MSDDRCDLCRKNFPGPVVRDDIWKIIANRSERMLCGFCMSDRMAQRLGRVLRHADLKPCPFNLFQHPHSWFAMLMRDQHGPPTNMAEWRNAAADLQVKL
jgi:hypothetical protein